MIVSCHIGLSYACNMRCKHCFVHREKDRSFVENNFKSIIDSLYKMSVMFLFYTFGEPTLSEKFYDSVEYAKKRGFYQILMSNGYFIQNDDVAKKIIDAGINKSCISIDYANEQKHDINRGVKGAWQKALNSLEILKNNKMKTTISCTIRESNISDMDEIYQIGIDKKVNEISFLRERGPEGVCSFSRTKEKEYIENLIRLIERPSSAYPKIIVHDRALIPTIRKTQILDSLTLNKYIDMNTCFASNNLSIAPNGDVYRCSLNYKCDGNLSTDNIEEIIQKKVLTCYMNTKKIKREIIK